MLVSYEDKKSMVPHHVELNKLTIAALMRLCVAFGVDGAKATSSKEELVDIVKRCFKKWKLDEFDALEVGECCGEVEGCDNDYGWWMGRFGCPICTTERKEREREE